VRGRGVDRRHAPLSLLDPTTHVTQHARVRPLLLLTQHAQLHAQAVAHGLRPRAVHHVVVAFKPAAARAAAQLPAAAAAPLSRLLEPLFRSTLRRPEALHRSTGALQVFLVV
jgi:hypothetical protein